MERVYDLLGNVFTVGRAFFQKRLDYDAAYDPETTWVATVEGELAASVQLFPYDMRVGEARLKIGGIGSVSSDPRFRGMGLVHGILLEMTEWMKKREYDLSLLFTGIHPFYEKVGWETVEEPRYELDAASVAGSYDDSVYRISSFSRSDLEEIMAVCDAYNAGNTNSRIRSAEYWDGLLKWSDNLFGSFLTARKKGRIVAYAIAGNEKDGAVELQECAFMDGEGAAMKPLFAALAAGETVKRLSAVIPEDGILSEALRSLGPVDVQIGNYSMWKIIGFAPMLRKLEPVFTRRLVEADEANRAVMPERVLLRCGGEKAVLAIGSHGAAVLPASETLEYDEEIKCTAAEFSAMLTQGSQVLTRESLKGHPVVRALFPGQRYAMWKTEAF
ncbi:hypothetical protein VN24_14565 [Paenibacillus beijingensis]|uniref:N-acetyltransferase domain-containing protein n=2 Tax=Paenibacillus beijingensis TaxID=1126833 RepID=A0A0D5NJW4_9BACL|nr:hypothetical protein VN24_14565 [Paenibacillus beijingensis]